MTVRRIGLEVGQAYTLTVGHEQTVVTALASPWAESRIAVLETALRIIAGREQCVDNLMSNVEVAIAALDGRQ